MSSPSERFECSWQASRLLLMLYLALQALALASLSLLSLPVWALLLLVGGCLGHAAWVLPRQILLTHPAASRALRRDAGGWALWSQRDGWQTIELRPDSLALPVAVVLRYRLAGARWTQGLCIPRDAMGVDEHRRLRVRLKFSRNRWAAAE